MPIDNCSSDTFQEFLVTRWLPSMYRDGDYPGIVNLLQFMARFMDELSRDACTIPYMESVFDVPIPLLPFLAGLIDATLDNTKSYPEQLLELRKTVNLYKIRGIPYSFYHVLKYAGATYYGIIQTLYLMIFLDIFPMDSIYAMEGSHYYNPAIIDIYANIDFRAIKAQLLALVPAGVLALFAYLVDVEYTDTVNSAAAIVALPQLWFSYGNSPSEPWGYKQIDTNVRVDLNTSGTIHVGGLVYLLDPSAGAYVYLRGSLDYGELPNTTFNSFYIYYGLTQIAGPYLGRALLPSQVSSPGTLLYTLTPVTTNGVTMDTDERTILQAIITF